MIVWRLEMMPFIIAFVCVCVFLFRTYSYDDALANFAKFEDRMLPSDMFNALGYQTLSESQCAELCWSQDQRGNLACQSFELLGTQTCILSNVSAYLRSGHSGYDSFVPAPGSKYYELAKKHVDLFVILPGYVFVNDRKYNKLFNASAEECAKTCMLSSGFSCNSFAYSQSKRICALSADIIRSTKDLKKVKNYDMFEYSGNWPCNVTLPWRYTPRIIASSRYPFYSRLNQTCRYHLRAPPMKTIKISIRSLFVNCSICSQDGGGIFIFDGLPDQSKLMLHICRDSPELVTSSIQSSGDVTIRSETKDFPIVFKITYDFADHDTCDGHRCKNGGSCIHHNQSYSCACTKEFTGSKCETDVNNSCESNPCMFGKCIDKNRGYECHCYKGATGQRCETFLGECSRKPCKYGKCKPSLFGYLCDCTAGYTGRNCEYEINECYSSPCGVYGHCIDGLNNYTCLCDRNHTGRNCQFSMFQKSCYGYECKYGTCAVNESGSFCQCFPGFSGSLCEVNIDECQNSPCGVHGRCVDHINRYSCECFNQWYGSHCNISKSDVCQNSNCYHGYCSIISPKGDHECICETNYTGSQCSEMITPCLQNPCVFGKCIEIGSNFKCKCNVGYEGVYCDVELTSCKNNSCVHGVCVDGAGNYTCYCDREWTGTLCNVKINPCTDVNCNSGRCVESSKDEGFECICESNNTGRFCEFITNPCLSLPCEEHSTCEPNGSTFVCLCESHRTGRLCEHSVNYCLSSPCAYGRCSNNNDSYTCHCYAFYTGQNCENTISFSMTTEITPDLFTVTDTHRNHTGITGVTIHSRTGITDEHLQSSGIGTAVYNHSHTGFIEKDKSSYVETTVANKHNDAEVTYANKQNQTEVSNANKRNSSLSIKEIVESSTSVTCNENSCVHGDCKPTQTDYECHCKHDFTGKYCNISLPNAENKNNPVNNNNEESSVNLAYTGIVALCLCLLFFLIAGIAFWYRRARKRRGTLYISNSSESVTKDTNSYSGEEKLHESKECNLKENVSIQRKPITRCAWYLSSGNSGSSEDSRQWNKYDDVNIGVKTETSSKNVENACLDPQTGNKETDNETIQLSSGNKGESTAQNSASALLCRPILIRPPDKKYLRCPGFQTVDGVQNGKSDV